ncbi:MAG: VCBS repeat-containing protein [Acidobacteria bacterium]|nr:VCBS repeat-containing protein [Acidobacteriota bacterium]
MKARGLGLFICFFLTVSIAATDNSFKLDFDGDGRTDLALYREGSRDLAVAPQPSIWYFLSTRTGETSAVHWGRSLDVPAPADYDGDGKTDVGVYRWWNFDSGDANEWWLSRSTGGHQVLIYEPGYNKFNRNYIGDARAEIGQLYTINISQNPAEPCYMAVYFIGDLAGSTLRKTVGDACNVVPTPVPGDYNNDGRSEIAVFDNHTFKVWLPPYSAASTAPDIVQYLDVDQPVPGDYDGDGKTDFAGTRGVGGRLLWTIRQSSNGQEKEYDFGFATDKAVPGDYDGDGKTDIAVWRPANGSWWIINSQSGEINCWIYGLPTDTPLATPVIPFDPSY